MTCRSALLLSLLAPAALGAQDCSPRRAYVEAVLSLPVMGRPGNFAVSGRIIAHTARALVASARDSAPQAPHSSPSGHVVHEFRLLVEHQWDGERTDTLVLSAFVPPYDANAFPRVGTRYVIMTFPREVTHQDDVPVTQQRMGLPGSSLALDSEEGQRLVAELTARTAGQH